MYSRREHPDLGHLDAISEGVPWTHPRACHLLYQLVLTFTNPEVLEIACCYGKATIYLAAGAKRRGGSLMSIDIAEYLWAGRSAVDLLREAGVLEACRVEFGCDATWYLLDLLRESPGQWIDFVYLDLTHTVEVDSFVALATWTHLRPGGILVVDDLDWVPAIHGAMHGLQDMHVVSRLNVSHVRAIFDYLAQLPDVADTTEWGKEELEWTWGFLRKRDHAGPAEVSLTDLVRRLDKQSRSHS